MATKKRTSRAKKPADDTPNTRVERFRKSLPVPLTQEEVSDRADRASHILADRDQKEDEAKAAAKHYKSVVAELDTRLRLLSNEVRTRRTYNDVECERRYEYTAGRLVEVRTDTGEEIFERPLTEAEKQQDLPFDDSEPSVDDEFGEAAE